MPAGAPTTLHVWDGYLLFAAHEIVTSFHAHYAASVIVSGAENIQIEDGQGKKRFFRAVFLPPNFYHKLTAAGTDLLVIQIDPDHDQFHPLRGLPFAEAAPLSLDEVTPLAEKIALRFSHDCTCEESADLMRAVLRTASPNDPPPRRLDRRIDQVLETLRNLDELPEDITTAEMAHSVGLSEDRFRAVFKEHMGLPFRRYLLWLRLRRAGFLLADGITLTEAAHAAGFYDSAHFSRTFREMFGQAPSRLFDPDGNVRVKFC